MKYTVDCILLESKERYYLNKDYDFQEELSDNVLWDYDDIDFDRLEKKSRKYNFYYKINKFEEGRVMRKGTKNKKKLYEINVDLSFNDYKKLLIRLNRFINELSYNRGIMKEKGISDTVCISYVITRLESIIGD